MCSWLFVQWGGSSTIVTTKIVFENPQSLFFFFFFQTVSSLPLQAAEIEELSYVKKHCPRVFFLSDLDSIFAK